MVDVRDLLTSIQAGEREAFDTLVARESTRLRGIAFHITGDEGGAEDVVQEVFLRIFAGRAPFRGEGTGEAWLTRLTASVAVDTIRRRKARVRREEARLPSPAAAIEPEARELKDEEARIVAETFSTLPRETRAALWLHVVEGETVRQVAERLGRSRPSVHRQMQSGLKSLRQLLVQRGLLLPLTWSLRESLSAMPVPGPSSRFLEQVHALDPRLSPSPPGCAGVAEPFGTPARSASRLLRELQRPAVLAPLAVALLLFSLTMILWFARPFGPQDESQPGGPQPSMAKPLMASSKDEIADLSSGGERSSLGKAQGEAAQGAIKLEGIVRDSDGEPVAGAQVLAYEDFAARDVHSLLDRWEFVDLIAATLEGIPPLGKTHTAEDGKFTLSVPEPQDLMIYAYNLGERVLASGPVRVTKEAIEPIVQVLLRAAVAIEGDVVDHDGFPLANAGVALIPHVSLPKDRELRTDDFQSLLERFVPLHARTGLSGIFQLPPVQIEDVDLYELVAQSSGHGRMHMALTSPPAKDLELALESAEKVEGIVLDEMSGKPLGEVRLLAVSESWFDAAISSDNGLFAFDVATDVELVVYAKLPGRVMPARLAWRRQTGPRPIRIEISGGGQVTGRVSFVHSGQPAAGVRVLCRGLDGALVSAESVANDRGEYAISGLPIPANYEVFPGVAGFVATEPFVSPPTTEIPQVSYDFGLVRTASIRGKVTGPRGVPVSGAAVEVIAAADSEREGVFLRWRKDAVEESALETDENGEFSAEDVVRRGKVFVWAYHPELGEAFSAEVVFPPAEPSVAQAQVRIEPARLQVQAVDTTGQPIKNVKIDLIAEPVWHWVPDGMHMGQWYQQRTSMDTARLWRRLGILPGGRWSEVLEVGAQEWTNLMASRYQIALLHNLGDASRSNWEREYWLYMGLTREPLSMRDVTRVRLLIYKDRKLTGHVASPDGKELPALRVQVWFSAEVPGLEQVSGYSVTHVRAGGDFEAEGVGVGPYRITVQDVQDRIVELKNLATGTDGIKIIYDPAK